ncbi:acidic leucine-rich nuclear phosphoprotein 32-related protein 1 isoform X2 [Morone saxatilis]|uniref:acidic leucine-rich nuclear phosphoprotein 32-related protein 1 isoform X2 n=1 Tax=Morone saxatilis TaxID=34816 RepID=UPI0015E2524B|nr:acidic leucine-rich nuclear phosphoprotein 32-related protein 1 isoform X2 [Morone saxatilis]
MEQSFSDLLSDAFSDTSVPSFPDGDLDFENFNFDEKFEDKSDISYENLTKEEEAVQQEATLQTAVLSDMETKDIYMAENVDEEQSDEEGFQGVRVMGIDKTPEEDYTSSDGDSEQESSVSGDDEEEDEEEDMGTGEEPGDLLMSVHCGNEFCDGNKEDRLFAQGQPLAPEGAENPQVRNEEQGESESDEEVSYFERVPVRGSEMMTKGDGIEEDEQEREEKKREDSSDSECEGMKIEQVQNVLAQCFERELENPCRDVPEKASGVECPEISAQNLQDLLAEVDGQEYVEKMKDFSGEEHQEADLLTTEDTDKAETLLSDVTAAEDVNTYSAVQREDAKTTSPSNQGSLDDSFFFNTELEASEISEMGQLGDDESEEDRNWEQEQERIRAFYEFYDDSDGENGREGRQIKVQFCADPLSQIIHYETDSSDRDSLSSSTDREEELSSAETSEELREPEDIVQMKPVCDPPNTQLPENVPDLCNTPNCTRKHKCLDLLKLTLKMGVVVVTGLMMFWLATDQAGWFSHVFF